MERKTNFSRRPKQFDGQTWLTPTANNFTTDLRLRTPGDPSDGLRIIFGSIYRVLPGPQSVPDVHFLGAIETPPNRSDRRKPTSATETDGNTRSRSSSSSTGSSVTGNPADVCRYLLSATAAPVVKSRVGSVCGRCGRPHASQLSDANHRAVVPPVRPAFLSSDGEQLQRRRIQWRSLIRIRLLAQLQRTNKKNIQK